MIAELVKVVPPAKILHRAVWGKAAHHLGKKTEAEIDIEAGMSLRMIDYIQSIIVAVPTAKEQENDVTAERWQELEKLVHDLFMQLNTEFMACQTAVNRREPSHDKEFDEFYFKAQMMWCNVRGKRYVPHEIPFYRDVLSPHDNVLKEIYDIGVEEILGSLQNIQDSATRGIPQATIDFNEFRRLTLDKLDEKLKGLAHFPQLPRRITKD
jgi:hypothetical protein